MQKSRALRKLERMGFITLGRQGRAVTATLTEASGVLVWGQDFEPGRGYIRAFRGPAFKRALESRTLELELEVWLRSRAWSDGDWVWAEFSTEHVPGMTRKQVRTALEKLKQNRVLNVKKHPRKQVMIPVTIEGQNGYNPKSDKTCVMFLTGAVCETGEEAGFDTKGQAPGKKGPAKGPVNKKGLVKRDSIKKENEPPATRPASFSNFGQGGGSPLSPDEMDIEDIDHIPGEIQSPAQTRALIRARSVSSSISRTLELQPQTRLALQAFLQILFTRNINEDPRFLLQDLRGMVDPENEGPVRDWLWERVRVGNHTWDPAELGLYLTRKDRDLDLDPEIRERVQALRPYLDPDSREYWGRLPGPRNLSLEQRLEERAEFMIRQEHARPGSVDPELVCSLYFFAEEQGMAGARHWVRPVYSVLTAVDRTWLRALEIFKQKKVA
jgi:hypothetical protein